MNTWRENIEILPSIKAILPQNNPKKPYYNPSLVRYKGKLLISIRSSTWTLTPDGAIGKTIGDVLHSDVLLGEVDEEKLTTCDLVRLKYAGNVHQYIKNIGLEDARLYVRNNKLYATGVCMSKNDGIGAHVYIAQGEIKNKELCFGKLVPKPHPERIEKNWTIPDVATDAFDYIYSPTQVLKDNKLVGEHEYHGLLHGGSQAIKWEDGWLSFQHKIHRVKYDDQAGLRQYVSYAIKYDKNGFAREISQGFLLFGNNKVEFISGLVLGKDGKLLVSLGLGDACCVLAKIDYKDLIFKEYRWDEEAIRAYLPPQESWSLTTVQT